MTHDMLVRDPKLVDETKRTIFFLSKISHFDKIHEKTH